MCTGFSETKNLKIHMQSNGNDYVDNYGDTERLTVIIMIMIMLEMRMMIIMILTLLRMVLMMKQMMKISWVVKMFSFFSII